MYVCTYHRTDGGTNVTPQMIETGAAKLVAEFKAMGIDLKGLLKSRVFMYNEFGMGGGLSECGDVPGKDITVDTSATAADRGDTRCKVRARGVARGLSHQPAGWILVTKVAATGSRGLSQQLKGLTLVTRVAARGLLTLGKRSGVIQCPRTTATAMTSLQMTPACGGSTQYVSQTCQQSHLVLSVNVS